MKGRTDEEGINPATDKPADDASVRGEPESRGGGSRSEAETASPTGLPEGRAKPGNHGTPQERTMIEEILDPENLAAAWKRVQANKGAPGIDGMTVGAFPAFAREHWPRIARAIMEGNYRPAPVHRAWIDSLRSPLAGHSSGVSVSLRSAPKPDGGKRPPGVPTVLDRVIQQAIAQVLGPLFEADFSEHSHGYRPGRSAHDAVAEMEACWKEGRRHAVECDLKSFFDTVSHERLTGALREKVRCPRVLGLI